MNPASRPRRNHQLPASFSAVGLFEGIAVQRRKSLEARTGAVFEHLKVFFLQACRLLSLSKTVSFCLISMEQITFVFDTQLVSRKPNKSPTAFESKILHTP